MEIEKVILVDINDREIGREEKLLAHQKGMLHRAFSAFVVRPDGRMLLQRRAMVKYHSPSLWSNITRQAYGQMPVAAILSREKLCSTQQTVE